MNMNNDIELIAENYKKINVKSLMLESSFGSFEEFGPKIQTLEEAEAILDIYDTIEEAFPSLAGLKNLGRGAMQSAQQAGTAISNKAQQAGTAISNKAQQAGTAIANKAQQAGSSVAAGAQQVGSNVQNLYQTGKTSGESQKVIKQAQAAAQQIIDLVNKAKELSPETFQGSQGRELAQNITNLKLSQVMGYLDKLSADTTAAAQTASEKGVFGGVGTAAKQAANQSAQPAAAQPQQAAQPAAAPISPIFQK
jgi:hypothetical protein